MSSQNTQAAPSSPPRNERRIRTRHPISVPATVRLRGPGLSATPTLILDLSEDGIGVQTPTPLPAERTLALDLDLRPELPDLDGRHRIRLIGQVAWSQPDGRAGVRFFSPDHAALQAIQQWLFLNAVAGAAGTVRLPELLPLAERIASAQDDPAFAPITEQDRPQFLDEREQFLRNPERLPHKQERFLDEEDQAEHVLSPLDRDINAIVSRALALTGAKGAALALYEGDQLICRAICGTDTPGLGARISTDSGITGECIRFAQVMYCSNAASDPRVDHEICIDLGIRSILALPLFAGPRVVGLLEVLSQRADAFHPGDAKALDLMARPVIGLLFAEGESGALRRAAPVAHGVSTVHGEADVARPEPEVAFDAMEPLRSALARTLVAPKLRFYPRVIAAVAAFVVIGSVTWLVISQTRILASLRQPVATASHPDAPHLASVSATTASVPGTPSTAPESDPASSLEELKSAARTGDASAQYALGAHYATTQDYATAARWFTLSAKKGYAPAQGILGAYYWSGRGLQKDLKQAYFWSVLARDGNDEISKDRVDSLVAQLDRSQMLEVQQLVRDWYRKHQPSAQPSTTASAR